MSKYITTPIYYINDIPHIGHAYTTIAADVLSRYYKLKGEDVFLLTGTDEHGAKIAEAAEKAGKSPEKFIEELVPKFKETWSNLNIEYSEFFQTTNPKHEKLVQEFVSKLQELGYIEKRKYKGLYCVGCEKFLTKDDLVDGRCPDHKTEPVKQSEENYFFLLKKAAKDFDLKGKIEAGQIKVSPQSRKNEVLGKIKVGLEDVSISRESVEWGVKFPGDDTQTVYVWVDALLNYYSATKIYKDGPKWPADLHLMAKDILWFHAIIWPAMLLVVGEELPKEVFAHGFFTVGGQKMSKTVGNVLDPNDLVKKFGADAVRYALLREFPFGADGDISEEKIAARYQNDLGNELGNLLQRTLTIISKNNLKVKIMEETRLDDSIRKSIENLEFNDALRKIWGIVRFTNQFIDEKKPWEMVKVINTGEVVEVMEYIVSSLEKIRKHLEPFMPETSEKMKKQLKTLKPEPLFPRLEN